MKKAQDIYLDLGFSPAEAANLHVRADLMNALIEEIRRRKLPLRSSAKVLDVSQRRASDLLHGNIHLFTVDDLMMMARAAGIRVDVRIKRPAA